MKTYSLALTVTAGIAATLTVLPAQAQQVSNNGNQPAVVEQQLQQLQERATGTVFEVAQTRFRVVPDAQLTAQAEASDPGTDLVVGDYRVQLPAVTSRQARSLAKPANKQVLVMSDDGQPAVLTSTMTVFFNDLGALQQAAKAAGGKVGYASRRAGMGSIEFDSAARMLEAISQVQGQAGIRGAEPELIQSTQEIQ